MPATPPQKSPIIKVDLEYDIPFHGTRTLSTYIDDASITRDTFHRRAGYLQTINIPGGNYLRIKIEPEPEGEAEDA